MFMGKIFLITVHLFIDFYLKYAWHSKDTQSV